MCQFVLSSQTDLKTPKKTVMDIYHRTLLESFCFHYTVLYFLPLVSLLDFWLNHILSMYILYYYFTVCRSYVML